MTRSEPPGKRRRPSRSTRCKGAGFLRDVGLALALAFATVAVGQETNPHFDHLGEEQDLSTTRDNGITEDGAGFVWFATGVGLSRFDGYAFRSYRNTPEECLQPTEQLRAERLHGPQGPGVGRLRQGSVALGPRRRLVRQLPARQLRPAHLRRPRRDPLAQHGPGRPERGSRHLALGDLHPQARRQALAGLRPGTRHPGDVRQVGVGRDRRRRGEPARSYGFWRGLLDGVVARYLDCGIFERGFARIRCPNCAAEFLLAFSCKGRGLCPSCGAKLSRHQDPASRLIGINLVPSNEARVFGEQCLEDLLRVVARLRHLYEPVIGINGEDSSAHIAPRSSKNSDAGVGVQWELPGAVARRDQSHALGFLLNPPVDGHSVRTGGLHAERMLPLLVRKAA
jgi:Transposase zinc-binding domain